MDDMVVREIEQQHRMLNEAKGKEIHKLQGVYEHLEKLQHDFAAKRLELLQKQEQFQIKARSAEEVRQWKINQTNQKQKELDEVQAKHDLLQPKLDELESQVEEAKKKLEATRDNFNSDQLKWEEAKKNYAIGLQKYERFLGLRFEKQSDGVLRFIFTHILQEKPKKEFFCHIRVENEVWNIVNCSPDLPDTKELEDELNKTNDLNKFVINLRKQFVNYVSR